MNLVNATARVTGILNHLYDRNWRSYFPVNCDISIAASTNDSVKQYEVRKARR